MEDEKESSLCIQYLYFQDQVEPFKSSHILLMLVVFSITSQFLIFCIPFNYLMHFLAKENQRKNVKDFRNSLALEFC